MLNIFCVICIAIGSCIMANSIYKYSKSVIRANSIQRKHSYYRYSSYSISLCLMCFFLIGYIFTAVALAFVHKITLDNIVIAPVFLFGAVFVDIMIKVQTQMSSLYAKEVLRTITDNIDNMIHVVDPTTFEILFVNRPMAEYSNKHESDLIGKTCWKTVKANKKSPCQSCPANQLRNRKDHSDIPMYWENEDENGNVLFVSSTFVRWIDGRNVLMCNSIDITDRKKQEKYLQICATTDRLTGAYNRTWGHQILDNMFKPGSSPTLPLTFCFLDLDYLKYVNDTFGHEYGDELLRNFAKCIQTNIRQQDSLIRWGGDEFVLLLQCNQDNAYLVIQKIQDYITNFNQSLEKHSQLHFSYGMEEMIDDPNIRWETLVSNADMKMYQQKIEKKSSRTNTP